MKKIYWILIILVVAILAGTAFFLYEWNRPNKDVADLEPEFTLTAAELSQELVQDPSPNVVRYSEKVIQISGVVNLIDTDQAGNRSLIFTNDDGEVQCTFHKSEQASIASLQEGDEITVKGKFTGYLADELGGIPLPGQAKLNNCILVK